MIQDLAKLRRTMRAKAGLGLVVILGLVFLAGCPPKFRYHPADPANPNYRMSTLTPTPDLTQTFFAYTATSTFTMTPTFTPIQETWTWTPTSTWTPTASPTVTPKPKRVFVTSTTQVPQGSLAAMDAVCQNRADAAILGGVWIAWLSDSGADAKTRVADVGPWYLVDGVSKVADNMLDLTDGTIASLLNLDEFGNQVSSSTDSVWTGTDSNGTGFKFCCDWSASCLETGSKGRAWMQNCRWTRDNCGGGSNLSCDGAARLYCFEQ